jgi:hypothetical protein
LQALPRNLGPGNTSNGDQAREKKRLLSNRRTDAGPAKSAREGGSVCWSKENHSRFYSLDYVAGSAPIHRYFYLTSFWGVASIPAEGGIDLSSVEIHLLNFHPSNKGWVRVR